MGYLDLFENQNFCKKYTELASVVTPLMAEAAAYFPGISSILPNMELIKNSLRLRLETKEKIWT
jgi:hypothetical protein